MWWKGLCVSVIPWAFMLVPVKAKITRDSLPCQGEDAPTLEQDLGRKLEGECLVVLAHGAWLSTAQMCIGQQSRPEALMVQSPAADAGY